MTEGNQTSVTVRTRKGVEQRSRGGHTFGKEAKTVLVTAEGLEAIKADPRLNIVEDAKPEPKADSVAEAFAKPKQKK